MPSVHKYWRECPYPIYVGCNDVSKARAGTIPVAATPSSWGQECLEQIAQLRETHLIVLLDDYLIQAPVDQETVSRCVEEAVRLDLPYLRLVPLRKSPLDRLAAITRSNYLGAIRPIKEGRPFYSGLQAAIWNKSHFAVMLGLGGSIWEFEHVRRPTISHYAITGRPPIIYSHLVEKGRWLPYAKRLLTEAGLSADLGGRPVWPAWMHLRRVWDELRFLLLGYANH